MKIVCDKTNNTPETLARGEVNFRLEPETASDIGKLIAARLREMLSDPTIVSVERDPDDATKIIVTRTTPQ